MIYMIYEDLHRYDHKIVFFYCLASKIVQNIRKNNFVAISELIFANLHKYWNNAMSNDGLIIEAID